MEKQKKRSASQEASNTNKTQKTYSLSTEEIQDPVKKTEMLFGFTSERIETAVESVVQEYNSTLDEIAALQTSSVKPTFETTFARLSKAEGQAASSSWMCTLPSMVSTNAEVRKASTNAKKRLKDMWIDSYNRVDLYNVLRAAAAECTDVTLDSEDLRLIDKMLAKFKRNGLDMQKEARDQCVSLKKEISTLCSRFEENINEDATYVSCTKRELEGLPENVLSKLECVGEEFKVGMKAPTLIPAMKFVNNSETRKKLLIASRQKCMDTNGPILDQILTLKHELALKLGYQSHAHFTLENKMAQNPKAVADFLMGISNKLTLRQEGDMRKLVALKAEHMQTEEKSTKLEPWDRLYYARIQKEKHYSIDEQKIKQYFPLWSVVSATLDIYAKLLHVRFEEQPEEKVWHPDVKAYKVYYTNETKEGDKGAEVGSFYLDLFPRDGKYGHQCVYPLLPSYCEEGKEHRPSAVNIGNLNKPSSDDPSLLGFEEVRTFFHEFGHIMHTLCTHSKHSLFAWAWEAVPWPGGVEGDFLEAPSQMLENWIYDPKVLEMLSQHYITKEVLPSEQLAKLTQIRYLNAGLGYQRQIYMSLFDLIIHTKAPPYSIDWLTVTYPQLRDVLSQVSEENTAQNYFKPNAELSVVELWSVLQKALTKTDMLPNTNYAASFYHLVMGYDAGYYGYLWSEVYSHDMFGVFLAGNGCLDTEMGRHYRDSILLPGASKDGAEMLKNFLGRAPNSDQFYKALEI